MDPSSLNGRNNTEITAAMSDINNAREPATKSRNQTSNSMNASRN